MLIAMGVAAARLARQVRPEPPAANEGLAAVPEPQLEVEVLTDLSVIAGKVNVEIQRDGSAVVTGIPDSVPEDLGRRSLKST